MITCKFKCKQCGVGPTPFEVRPRGPGEDVVHWVREAVQPAMGEAHRKQGPFCKAGRADLLIPVPPGDKGIGEE